MEEPIDNTEQPTHLTVPKKSLVDSSVELLQAIAASVPGVATFGALIQTNQQIEMGFFFEDVAQRVNSLQDQVSEMSLFNKAMQGDEKAAEIVVKSWRRLATSISEAYDEEKKEALRSAGCSVAMSSDEGETAAVKHDFFMKLVREFDGIHIKLLRAAEHGINAVKPIIHGIDGGGRMMAVAAPEGGNAFTPKVAQNAWNDLYSYGLVNTDSVNTMMTQQGYEVDRRTDVGVKFLDFITMTGDD